MSPPNGNVILSPLADWEGDRVDTAGTATSADTPGNKIELIALDRNEFYLWKDMAAQEKYQSGTNYYDAGILYLAGDKSERYIDGIWRRYLIEQKKAAAEANDRVPPKYPFLHVVADGEKPKNERVHIRGSADNLGEEVPRRFLSVLAKGEPAPFTAGSGRLELAEAIGRPDNPLTARVMVNRIWLHHFGHGLVDTPNNFGQMGERPSHPELLDYLAARFVENNWSIKAMHREIMNSAVYALASAPDAANQEADPDNRLLWRASRRRLDFEAMRDSMLYVAGLLDEKRGGPAEPERKPHNRRTVYCEITRKNPDLVLSLFDFPNPVASGGKRVETSTPLQGLYLLNSEEVMRIAAGLAARLEKDAGTAGERIARAYQLLLNRDPSREELAAGLAFVQSPDGGWTNYAQVLLTSNEFIFTP
jgi:hypothetical protein